MLILIGNCADFVKQATRTEVLEFPTLENEQLLQIAQQYAMQKLK